MQQENAIQSIDDLDVNLFCHVPTQLSTDERLSLLAVQSVVARGFGSYSYLEIGSHLGGSIQPHLVDPRCRKIYSIDPRPLSQPDNRGGTFEYRDNSTERMISNLRSIDATMATKVQTFELDARDVDTSAIKDPPHVCFIDGEHTDDAAESDFRFCLTVCHPRAVICFHDAWVVYPALRSIRERLRAEGVGHRALVLLGSVFALALDGSPILQDKRVSGLTKSLTRYSLYAILRMWCHRLLGGSGVAVLRLILRPVTRRLIGR